MNSLKIYLRTKGNIKEQAETYAQVFQGKVLKNSFLNTQDPEANEGQQLYNFAYVEILNDLKLLIAFHRDNMPTRGYSSDFVLTIEDRDVFEKVYANLNQHEAFTMDYDKSKYNYGGGITIAKFFDKWGYGWVIETKK